MYQGSISPRERWIKIEGEGYVALRHIVSLIPRTLVPAVDAITGTLFISKEPEWFVNIKTIDGMNLFLPTKYRSQAEAFAAIEALVSGEDYD